MTVIVFIAQFTNRELDELLARRTLVIAAGEGRLQGAPAAAALFAGWCVLAADAVLVLDTPAAWAGATWRVGERAFSLWLNGAHELDANAAMEAGLCDAIIPPGRNADEWVTQWIGTRSELALDAASSLIESRGGDALERAEFARLFAAGEPQEGLRAFLGKRAPRF